MPKSADEIDPDTLCRHGASNCQKVCGKCGHKCEYHALGGESETTCFRMNCKCNAWVEPTRHRLKDDDTCPPPPYRRINQM